MLDDETDGEESPGDEDPKRTAEAPRIFKDIRSTSQSFVGLKSLSESLKGISALAHPFRDLKLPSIDMTDLTESLRSACDRSSERVALDINQSERQVEGLNPATDQLERAVEELKPRTLEDDPAFMRIHDILKNQFDAFSRFAESADEAAARNFRLTVTSVLIAVGSLLIAVISLIRAFIG